MASIFLRLLLALGGILSQMQIGPGGVSSVILRVERFSDFTKACEESEGKPLHHILSEDNPAMYIAVDPGYQMKSLTKRLPETIEKVFEEQNEEKVKEGEPPFQMHKDEKTTGYRSTRFSIGSLSGVVESSTDKNKPDKNPSASDGFLFRSKSNKGKSFLEDVVSVKSPWRVHHVSKNQSLNCVLHIETELPRGDKTSETYDALSLIIIELDFGFMSPKEKETAVKVTTLGAEGQEWKYVHKEAHYSNRLWTTTNPNFLLSGQLTGFDSLDYRTKIDPQHIVRPEFLHSTFDSPASITVNLSNWKYNSQVYMIFTSYKHLRPGERCQHQKEFDCTPHHFLGAANDHLCMAASLACDGLPNCGQEFLPNQDENCFKIHWSSVLLSLVSYILLAITLLLCLSCFARVLIQWSVRSSLAELQIGASGASAGAGGGGFTSPVGSLRSSSRLFSLFGSTFSSRWERPPPTYEESMKHVNPDLPPSQQQQNQSRAALGSRRSRSRTRGTTTMTATVQTSTSESTQTDLLNQPQTTTPMPMAAASSSNVFHTNGRPIFQRGAVMSDPPSYQSMTGGAGGAESGLNQVRVERYEYTVVPREEPHPPQRRAQHQGRKGKMAENQTQNGNAAVSPPPEYNGPSMAEDDLAAGGTEI